MLFLTPHRCSALHAALTAGTIGWMAPEIAENFKVGSSRYPDYNGVHYQPSADCFSLGIVLWECLSSRLPYDDLPDKIVKSMIRLGDAVIQGQRPNTVALQPASPAIVMAMEQSWHPIASERLTALQINEAITQEIVLVSDGQVLLGV